MATLTLESTAAVPPLPNGRAGRRPLAYHHCLEECLADGNLNLQGLVRQTWRDVRRRRYMHPTAERVRQDVEAWLELGADALTQYQRLLEYERRLALNRLGGEAA